VNEDRDFSQIKQAIKSHVWAPSGDECTLARKRIVRYYSLIHKLDYSAKTLPELLKIMAIHPCSCRRISGVFYDRSHHSHGDQYSGRELRRWAAIELGELFEDSAIINSHRFKDFIGEYWHEL
jgi:hypothetical protein